MSLEIIDCEQGSSEWFRIRMGMPTASNFKELLITPRIKGETFSKGAITYMYKLAGERLINEPMQNMSNAHMQRGHDDEPRARIAYYFETNNVVKQVGFMINNGAGYSPDGIVGDDGNIEIKSKLPHLQIETIIADVAPDEHIAQMQGGLWVSEREWCDFVSYCPRLLKPFIKRVHRDENLIEKIAERVRIFNDELDALVYKLEKWAQ
jgi:hypothetical protein